MNKHNINTLFRITAASLLACSVNLFAVPITAVFRTEEAQYNGENMCIAVLDNGFFTSHECFTLTTDNIRLTKEKSDALIKSTTAGKGETAPESLYISSKIPFAYDYGDGDSDVNSETNTAHGTAMISIAAGNKQGAKTDNPFAKGIAPEAQILAMKIYSDKTGSVTDTAIVNAIEDSVTLGADVILLPLANICGLESESAGDAVSTAISKAKSAGVPVVCPVGNVFEYGKDSFFELEYDSDPLPTSSVDIGTVAWPAVLPDVISVASAADNERTAYILETPSDFIPYSDSNYLYPELTGGKMFSSLFEGRTLEYVLIDGIGTSEEFASVGDLSGKIAIVERGTISFSEKTVNAAAAGAIGVMVIDNQPYEQVTFETKTDLSEAVLPLILVPMNCKNVFILEEEKNLVVRKGETYTVTTGSTPTQSPFSAAGTTPELLLKPDITAIGSEVGCASPDGGYAKISSTAAAAAKVSGMYVITKQKLLLQNSTDNNKSVSDTAEALLINSSRLMVQSASGAPYSPRYQGAGSADINAALSQDLLLHQNGNYKIELGELTSRFFTFKVTAQNLSDKEKQCTIDAIIGSDGYRTYTVGDIDIEQADPPLSERIGLNADDELSFITRYREFSGTAVRVGDGFGQLNRSAPDYEPFRLTLAPHSSVTMKISVAIGQEEYDTYNKVFSNGFFIEGFMRLTSDDTVASIPLLGFMGDFQKAPALDTELYSSTAPLFDGIYLYRTDTENSTDVILGEKTVDSVKGLYTYHRDALYYNPNEKGLSPMLRINLGLLRTVTDVSITVSDETGKVLKHTEYGTLARTYPSATSGMLESPRLPVFSFRADDNFKFIYPDGAYTVTVSFRKPSAKTAEALSYTVISDSSAPKITKYDFSVSEYKCILEIEAEDNIALNGIRVVDSKKNEAKQTEDGRYDTSLLTGQYIYAEAFDYAGNRTTVRIENPVYIPEDK